jgi:hypothetical protein
MKLRLQDISNMLPINIMWTGNSMMGFNLRLVEVFRRMKLELVNIMNLLPIRMMPTPNMVMRPALRRVGRFEV